MILAEAGAESPALSGLAYLIGVVVTGVGAFVVWWAQETIRRRRIERTRRVQLTALLRDLRAVVRHVERTATYVEEAWLKRMGRVMDVLKDSETIAALTPKAYGIALRALSYAEHISDLLHDEWLHPRTA